MTSQGSPQARLQRAIASRNALMAWATPSELPHVSLDDALALCLLLAESDPARFKHAAVRWLPRRREAGGQALASLCQAHGLERAVLRLEDWLKPAPLL